MRSSPAPRARSGLNVVLDRGQAALARRPSEGIEALDGPLHDAPSGEGETRLIQMMSSSGRQHGALRKGWSST